MSAGIPLPEWLRKLLWKLDDLCAAQPAVRTRLRELSRVRSDSDVAVPVKDWNERKRALFFCELHDLALPERPPARGRWSKDSKAGVVTAVLALLSLEVKPAASRQAKVDRAELRRQIEAEFKELCRALPKMAPLVNPLEVSWVASNALRKDGKGWRSDHLQKFLQSRGARMEKLGNKWHVERDDALRLVPEFAQWYKHRRG